MAQGHISLSPPPPSLAPAHPPFGTIANPLPRAKPPARSPPSLSLASQPHLTAPLSRALPLTGRPAPSVSRVVFLAYDAPPSPPSPSPRRPLATQEEFGTAPSSPLDHVLAQYRPVVESHRRRCATLMLALCTSPARAELRRSPPLGRL
jgi:hypothetical protein